VGGALLERGRLGVDAARGGSACRLAGRVELVRINDYGADPLFFGAAPWMAAPWMAGRLLSRVVGRDV